MDSFGFKIITSENWNHPDKTTVAFTCPFDYNQESGYPPYLDRILAAQLNDEVPIEIRRLFEVARGAMVYSYYFYPLYTLATDQLSRVGETALFHKSRKLGYTKEKPTFLDLIKFLKECREFDGDQEKEWEFLRGFRNLASHRRNQSIYPPSATLGALERYAKEINALFS
jgi:hypothetical protein